LNDDTFYSVIDEIDQSLYKDRSFVLAIAKYDISASKIHKSLLGDKEIAKAIIQKPTSCHELEYFDETIKADKDIVKMAIEQSGSLLEFASKDIQNDKAMVQLAITKDGTSIQFASEDLKNDEELVKQALIQDGYALEHVNNRFKDDQSFVEIAVKNAERAFEYASDKIKNDKVFVLKCIKNKIKILEYVSLDLKKDKEVVYNSVRNHGSELRYADDIFKKDKELVLIAVVTDWSVYTSIDKKLQIDKDVLKILEKNDEYKKHIGLEKVSKELESFFDELIDNHKEYFKEEDTFKVRPGVAYDKYYLNHVDGSYDMSLQGLIHHYMWEKKLYHLFLDEKDLEICQGVVENSPESIYGPEDDESLQSTLDEIYADAICFVGRKLIDLGFDVKNDFESYLGE